MTLSTARWRDLIDQVAADHPPLPADVFEAMIYTESAGDPNAKSDSNAIGLSQVIAKWHLALIDRVAKALGKLGGEQALYDPEVNLRVGAAHLVWCYTSDGSNDWIRAIRKYFTGSADPPPGFEDGQGTTPELHIAKFRTALEQVRADRGQTEEVKAMAYKAHTWPGLSKPVYLPDTLPASIQLVSAAGWTSGTSSTRQTTFTQHFTGNMNSSAQSERDWAQGGGRADIGSSGSYQLIVDGTEAIVSQRFDEMAGHAANNTGNYTSYASEMAIHGGYEAALQNAAYVAGGVIASKGWEVDTALLQHWNWLRADGTQKNCPSIIRGKGDWSRFVSMVSDAALAARLASLGEAAAGAVYVKPDPIPALDAISKGDGIAPQRVHDPSSGVDFIWVGDRVRAKVATGRYRWADERSAKLGPDIKKGEEFDVDWLFVIRGGTWWLYTPWGTRVKADDVERVSDTKSTAEAA